MADGIEYGVGSEVALNRVDGRIVLGLVEDILPGGFFSIRDKSGLTVYCPCNFRDKVEVVSRTDGRSEFPIIVKQVN